VLLGSQFSLEQNLTALRRLGLSESEMAAIAVGNAQRLFRLTDPGR